MSLTIIDPVPTSKYYGACAITLFDRNNEPKAVIDARENTQTVLKINNDNVILEIDEGSALQQIASDWSVGFLYPGFGNGIMSKSPWHAPKKQALQELKPSVTTGLAKSIILAELGCPSVFLTQVSTEELKTLQTCR
ncbi:hypothetical protein MGG_16501 [Pyricularia oryzae 70-15]|uniref:Uncharacterized protein n=1 Tax=Pyricularia oryzae (strain 70-15 / ATCC MYA-4617 / FGSC 8958) TaxID=242507 RepID=G4MQS5_PYRO7|nr:uncharacterized protein MGG_16494 [Pyricularia oryzae 70-15]XP_003710798.1 uncharacterized protein MGG_16501 [Pyricularia oryzae 70-15]EHA58156.1 hypothetical protein MGG_16494 [Pyricularia oryzae 70-15]EHA58186.1 hypothetical protein MGG_16501 [Pyricularia oryzae 70-15]